MPDPRMKTVAPSAKHLAFRRALEEAIRVHAADVDAADILAVMAHLVGQVVALQDQRKMTPEIAMEIVQSNMETGNAEMVSVLLNATGETP